MPDNFYDDYEGRRPAAAQTMSIAKDMDIIYDTKMYRKDKYSRLKGGYESFLNRLTPEDRVAYDAVYDSITDVFFGRIHRGRSWLNGNINGLCVIMQKS